MYYLIKLMRRSYSGKMCLAVRAFSLPHLFISFKGEWAVGVVI